MLTELILYDDTEIPEWVGAILLPIIFVVCVICGCQYLDRLLYSRPKSFLCCVEAVERQIITSGGSSRSIQNGKKQEEVVQSGTFRYRGGFNKNKTSDKENSRIQFLKPVQSGTFRYRLKTHKIMYQGDINNTETSTIVGDSDIHYLNLVVEKCQENCGWNLRGSTRNSGQDAVFSIERGYVNNKGEAFWVGQFCEKEILVRGSFLNPTEFKGEWMSSDDDRGHIFDFVYMSPESQDDESKNFDALRRHLVLV